MAHHKVHDIFTQIKENDQQFAFMLFHLLLRKTPGLNLVYMALGLSKIELRCCLAMKAVKGE